VIEFFKEKHGGYLSRDVGAEILNVICNAGLVSLVAYGMFRSFPRVGVASKIAGAVSLVGVAGMTMGVGMLCVYAHSLRKMPPI
jgi:hypothetical protein